MLQVCQVSFLKLFDLDAQQSFWIGNGDIQLFVIWEKPPSLIEARSEEALKSVRISINFYRLSREIFLLTRCWRIKVRMILGHADEEDESAQMKRVGVGNRVDNERIG